MFGKKMTPAEAEAALQKEAAKNKAKRADRVLRCRRCGEPLYAGERGHCRNSCLR